jgi:hypothetical protein
MTALHWGTFTSLYRVVYIFFLTTDSTIACYSGKMHCIEILLQHGATLDALDVSDYIYIYIFIFT